MAIIYEARYAKRLGLPGYSSHEFSVLVRTELTDMTQVEAESARLYALMQSAVDKEIQKPGFLPPTDHNGHNRIGHQNGQNGNGQNGNSHKDHQDA